MIKLKKKNRIPLTNTHDATEDKHACALHYANSETSTTTRSYRSYELEWYRDHMFRTHCQDAAKNYDADTPDYMDRELQSRLDVAVGELGKKRAKRQETIGEIINSKRVEKRAVDNERGKVLAEKERLKPIIQAIGGYDTALSPKRRVIGIDPSSGVNDLYTREDYLKQSCIDLRFPLSISLFAFILFSIISLLGDFMTIFSIQDKFLRGDPIKSIPAVALLVICADIILPIMLPKMIGDNFKQKKLRKVALVSLLVAFGLLIFFLLTQRVLAGANGKVTIFSSTITQLMYGLIPISTTIALLCMGLQRDNYAIYRKFRYNDLVESDLEVQSLELEKKIHEDELNLKCNDDIDFASTIARYKSDIECMAVQARMILAEGKSADEAERINRSTYKPFTTIYDEALDKNPNLILSFKNDSLEENNNVNN